LFLFFIIIIFPLLLLIYQSSLIELLCQICITSWSATACDGDESITAANRVDEHVDRFMCVHATVAALQGVPAFYFSLFMAGTNDEVRIRGP
jgi:hypothetical protein